MNEILILSGGLDSTTLLYERVETGANVFALSFNYGQCHKIELVMAAKTCAKLNIEHIILNIPQLSHLLKSALTTKNITIPEGHYKDENMKVTVVPNRNLIMLAIAASYGTLINAKDIYIAAHAGDHAIYPDCRSSFFLKAEVAINTGSYTNISIKTPYLSLSKADIIKRGIALNVDYSLTWTCYKGGKKACGKCGSCTERLEAFAVNGLKDPLRYKT